MQVDSTDADAESAPQDDVSHDRENLAPGGGGSTRLDRWLTAARWFKSRSQAQDACERGHVTVNGMSAKSSRAVQVGDKISARAPRGLVVGVVQAIEHKRQSPARARELYEDQSPPPTEEESGGYVGRRRGLGRPTKADRWAYRALHRNRRRVITRCRLAKPE